MKIIKDDVIASLQTTGGISYYWDSLYQRTPKHHTVQEIAAKTPTHVTRYLPAIYTEDDLHIFHSSYYRLPRNKMARTITTLHDFVYEKFVSGLRSRIHTMQKMQALRSSSAIICISKSTLNDCHQYLGESDATLEVIYNGFNTFDDVEACQPKTWSNERPFFIFVGSRASYKNFELAVALTERVPEVALVVVGGGALCPGHRDLLENALPDRSHVIQKASAAELKWLYQSSSLLLYPSKYEGFGMPPLEAAYQGCPSFTLNTPTSLEIYRDFFPICEANSFDGMLSFLRSLQTDRFTIDKTKLATSYNWASCAAKTFALMEQTVES